MQQEEHREGGDSQADSSPSGAGGQLQADDLRQRELRRRAFLQPAQSWDRPRR